MPTFIVGKEPGVIELKQFLKELSELGSSGSGDSGGPPIDNHELANKEKGLKETIEREREG